MKKFFAESKFIIGFFVLLTAVTFLSIADFENEKNAKSGLLDEFTLRTKLPDELPAVAISRQPASVREKPSLILSRQFFCGPEGGVRDQISQRLVMLNFKVCRPQKAFREVRLENTSNGFKAQVFSLGSSNFKTDYIQLNEGLNKLRLEAVLKDGQKITESLEILSGS